MKTTLKENMASYPVTTRPQEALAVAYARMMREKIRHLPVTDEFGDLVGIISDRDFKRAMWPMNNSAPAEALDSPSFQQDGCVADYMSCPVRTLPENSKLVDAVDLMIDKKVSAIVVMSGDEVAGIITHEDLLRLLAGAIRDPLSLSEMLTRVGQSPTVSRFVQLLSTAGI